MKIKKLLIDNFGGYTKFEAVFPSGVTEIFGLNGSGKSTLIKSILACFKGLAKTQGGLVGERYQFIGSSGRSAHLECTLHDDILDIDVVVTNHITKDTNQIKFEAPAGSGLTQEWLENLFSVALMSTKHFCSQTPKQQAMCLGINTEEFDTKTKDLKTEYTLLNRDYTNFGELIEPEKIDEVKTDELAVELEGLQDNRETRNMIIQGTTSHQNLIEENKTIIIDLENSIKRSKMIIEESEKDILENEKDLKKIDDPTEKINEVQEKIRTAGETNKKYNTWKTWDDDSKAKTAAKKLVDDNNSKKTAIEKAKIAYMKTFKFPFKGMAVDDNGGLTLKGRYFNLDCWSQGELELAIAKIAIWLNPEFRVRMIDDASLLDAPKKESIVKELTEADFQIMFFNVGNQQLDESSILLRECQRVDAYEEEKDELI